MSHISALLDSGARPDADRYLGLFRASCRAISLAPAPTKSWVYFIVRPSYPVATVKIGLSAGKPERRIAALQTGCPERLALITAVLGHASHEEALHCVAAQNWMRGEWFCLDPDLALLVSELVSRGLSKAMDVYAQSLVKHVDGYRGSEHHKFLKAAIKTLNAEYPILAARWAIAGRTSDENRATAKTLDQAQLVRLP